MIRFLSNFVNRIDAKGRVSVPASFRSILASADVQDLYCFQDFAFPAISAGGPELLARLERRIEVADPFSPEGNRMSLLVHGGGVFMKLDQEGRLMVTDFIRTSRALPITSPLSGEGIIPVVAARGVGDCAKGGTRGAGALTLSRQGPATRGYCMSADEFGGVYEDGRPHIPVMLPEFWMRWRFSRGM